VEGKRKLKADFKINIFKTINIANAEGMKGVNGGNNLKYSNNI